MSRLVRGILAVGLAAGSAASMSGCALVSETPGPVYGNPVNPTPVPGYKVGCATYPGVANALFDDYYSYCRWYYGPNGEIVVVQARG